MTRYKLVAAVLLGSLCLVAVAAAAVQTIRAPKTAVLRVKAQGDQLNFAYRLPTGWKATVDNNRQNWTFTGRRCLKVTVDPTSYESQDSPDPVADVGQALLEVGGANAVTTQGQTASPDPHLFAMGPASGKTIAAAVDLHPRAVDPGDGLRIYNGTSFAVSKRTTCSLSRQNADLKDFTTMLRRGKLTVTAIAS